MSTYCVYVLKVASIDGLMLFLTACDCTIFIVNLLFVICKKVKVAHTRFTERTVPELIPVLGSQPAGDVNHEPDGIGCHYFPPGQQSPPLPLRGLLPILLLGEQWHNGCGQFA